MLSIFYVSRTDYIVWYQEPKLFTCLHCEISIQVYIWLHVYDTWYEKLHQIIYIVWIKKRKCHNVTPPWKVSMQTKTMYIYAYQTHFERFVIIKQLLMLLWMRNMHASKVPLETVNVYKTLKFSKNNTESHHISYTFSVLCEQ